MTDLIQIGLGPWGIDWATKILPQFTDAKVTGWVDASSGARAAFVAETGADPATMYATVEEALEATGAVAAIAPVAIGAHAAVARQVLEAGAHLLLEKPFALDTATARELAGLAAERGLVFGIDQNYRIFPAAPVVRDLLERQAVGTIRRVSLEWHRIHQGVRDSNALVELAIHHFDLMRYLFGREAVAITCVPVRPVQSAQDRTPGASLLVELDGGLTIDYVLSSQGVDAQTPWPGVWRISGDEGLIRWGAAPDDHRAVSISNGDGNTTAIEVPELPLFERAGVLRAFIDAVEGSGAPTSPAADNAHSVAMLEAALTSARTGKSTRVEKW
ncbi:Gfo/Idh/MocA family oxidoreductase [Nonomuraea sp. NPDC049784]|uniref:Gfo/Idh/MocA family protein n=1 Tax=Nonomuraea sp. NPDC049784 TaxID=3154361 RepID=UPI0033C6A96F